MRTVVSTSHPDPARAVADHPAPIDDATLDPALADPPMQYSPQVQPPMLVGSASGSPPPQYVTTGSPSAAAADGAEWGDVPRLPPILQVEKQHVTTTATQAASASRRRNDAQFKCPVPGCGSTFTRRFNLRGHLRSHTEERPFVCEWPNCNKGFARQHDCKRHYALHNAKPNQHLCEGCGKTFSRTDALNRHLRSDGGSGCRKNVAASKASSSNAASNPPAPVAEIHSHPTDHPPNTLNGHYPISLAVQPPPPGPIDPNLHPHPHQIPAELSSQFLAGLLSGQQFLAATAAASDPSHHPANPYEGIIQGAPAPAPEPSPELANPAQAADEEERPTKRRAVSAGTDIIPVPVTTSSPKSGTDDRSTPSREQQAASEPIQT